MPWCICFFFICQISLVVLQVHVDYTIFIFLPLVRALDLLTGTHGPLQNGWCRWVRCQSQWRYGWRMICPFFWDPSQKNQLLPSNQEANCKSASLCTFSHCGVRNALLGCDTKILYVTVMGVVLTLTDLPRRDEIRRAPTALSPDMSAVAEHGFNVEPRVHLQCTKTLSPTI